MLTVSHLTKQYSTARGPLTVLSDATFSLRAGESAAIMGPSGSGKSSLLYALGGLEAPTSGTIEFEGRDPYALPASELAAFRNTAIGFVFQDHCLLPQCSVLENVLIPTLAAPKSARAKGDLERARALVGRVGLSDRIDQRPAELSGGERQRVAVARALIRKPRLLLCDEPTGNLDAATASSVISLLVDLHQEEQNVLIVVTHSVQVADRMPIRFDLAGGRLERRGAG
jgi:lipoprotein-releasing system ATP-binding protein